MGSEMCIRDSLRWNSLEKHITMLSTHLPVTSNKRRESVEIRCCHKVVCSVSVTKSDCSRYSFLLFCSSTTIVEISGSQTVTEGGNVALECLADGKPMPNITWSRLSDGSVVMMPLTDIRRQDAGIYRCTANNGIGSPAARDVLIDVQCECCNLQCRY